jgi:hypothetical protein
LAEVPGVLRRIRIARSGVASWAFVIRARKDLRSFSYRDLPPRDRGTLNARGQGEDDLLLECTCAATRMECDGRKIVGAEGECRKQDRGGKRKGDV